MKFVFWVIVILAALVVVRLLSAKASARERPAASPPGGKGTGAGRSPAAPAAASEPMVRCAHCGIHLPRSEALLQGGQTWCDSEHARLGARR